MLDLFGEKAVKKSDVCKWLVTVPRFGSDSRPNAIKDYIRGYNVVQKIKSMEYVESIVFFNDSPEDVPKNIQLAVDDYFKTRHKPCPILPKRMHK